MRVRNFLPLLIDNDTAASLVSWNTIPRGAKIQDLGEVLKHFDRMDAHRKSYLDVG